MSKLFVEDTSLFAIGDAIREKTGKEDLLTLEQMPEEIRGISGGSSEDSYYDAFWDAYQENGERVSYYGAFSGTGWNDETFNPKYKIAPVKSIENMFLVSKVTKIPKGTLDWSKVAGGGMYGTNSFNASTYLTIIEDDIDISNISRMNNAFIQCMSLETLSIYRDETSRFATVWTNAFGSCSALKNITFSLNAICASISFKDSPLLTDASIQSIIGGLKDLTGATTQTLTFHADVKAKLTDTQIATITNKNWTLA
jgi:hypothetical protein